MVQQSAPRKLTVLEKYFFTRTLEQIYSNFFVAGVYADGLIKPGPLSHALRRMILKYPSFSYNAFGKSSSKLLLKTVDNIRFDDVVEFVDLDRLKSGEIDELLTNDILARTFKYDCNNKPLWKLCVVNNETIIFYCDHLVLDGTSGANFHQILLEELSQADDNANTDKLDLLFQLDKDQVQLSYRSIYEKSICKPSVPLIIRTLSHEFTPKPIGKFFKKCYRIIVPDKSGLTGHVFEGKSVPKANDFEVKASYINVPSDTMKQILDFCRKNQVQFTSFLFHLSMIVVKDITLDKDVVLDFPINARDEVKLNFQQDKTFGVYIKNAAILMPSLPNRSKVNWDEVSKIQKRLSKIINSKSTFTVIGMLNYVNIRDYLMGFKGKPREATIVMSNLGLRKFATDNQIKQMYFNQALGFTGGFLNLNVISTLEGGMNIGISYHPDEEPQLKGVTEKLDHILNNIHDYL